MIRWLLATCLLAWSVMAPGAILQDLRFVSDTDGLRAELLFDVRAKYRIFTLKDPLRLVVDLEDTRAPRSPRIAVRTGPVIGVRSAVRGKGLRVVMDLSKRVSPLAEFRPPAGGRYHRLVIALGGPVGKPQTTTKLKLALPADKATRVKYTTRPGSGSDRTRTISNTGTQSSASVSAKATKKPVSSSAKQTKKRVAEPPPRDFIVAVDAGHGGKDPGAQGRHGTREKDVVLAIARRLKKDIDQVPGMRAFLIRSGDSFVDLRGRINKARKKHADMFVSVHADAFKKSSAHGASVFVLSRRGATSESARWLAKQENAPFLAGGVMLVDKDDDLRKVFLDMSKNASLEAGFGVAEQVLNRMGHITKLHSGRVERAGFLVLKSPDIPSILVETGFLSNPGEERKLRDPKHQTRLARAIRDGILAYFSRHPPTGTLLAVRKHNVRYGDTLSGIAHQYSVSLSQLREVNGIKGDRLRVGQVLRIPTVSSDG